MLIHHGAARSDAADSHLAWSLAAIAGGLNTAGFYAVGLYSSNMTGNVSALANHLAATDIAAATYLALVLTFISGAAVSAILINVGSRRNIARIYALSILTEAVLLSGLGATDLWLGATRHERLLAFGLSFLMGLQNAVVTRISNARIRTTHVTGMITDIGIELGNLVDAVWANRSHRQPQPGSGYDAEKLRLHGLTVLSFLCGGIVGVVAYKLMGSCLLFCVSFLLLGLAASGLVTDRRSRRRLGP